MMKKIFLFIFLCFSSIQFISGKSDKIEKVMVSLLPESEISIVVFTNLFSFDIKQSGSEITSEPISVEASLEKNKLLLSSHVLPLTIKNFKSENKMAQRDFYKLVNADQYPEMMLEVGYFEFTKNSDNVYEGDVLLNVTISNVQREYRFPIVASINGDKLSTGGKKRISIRDFDLEPPTALMGMIRVSEWIEINLNIECNVL